MSEFGEFKEFIKAMQDEYFRHYPEKGDSWKDCDPTYLENEVVRLSQVFVRTRDPTELVDIANMCAMAYLRASSATEGTEEVKK